MNTNRLAQSSHPVATAVEIATNLLQFAEHFGIPRDSDFAIRTSTLAFTAAVTLAKHSPESAARLAQILTLSATETEFCHAVATGPAPEVPEDETWLNSLRQWLTLHLSQAPETIKLGAVPQQIVCAARIGLAVGATQPEFTERIKGRVSLLNDEPRFLAWLLASWARNNFRPFAEPFVEFVFAYYPNLPIERNVLSVEARQTLACAQLLSEPWRLSFWTEQAWSRGRGLAENHPDIVRQLLAESPKRNREFTLALYRTLILEPQTTSGRIDIQQATLAFLARSGDGRYAIEYCAGWEPRKLARLAFDFAFWMGILSAIPLPADALTSPSRSSA